MKKKSTRQVKQPSALVNRPNVNNTDTAAQRLRLLAELKKGSVTTPDARARLNIMAPAPRVKELREQGYIIQTIHERLSDDYGRPHNRVARYVLVSTPK